MQEVVIVLSDLYLPPAPRPQEAGPLGSQARVGSYRGLEYVTRFGQHAALARGWRSWLLNWRYGDSVGVGTDAPASIAARASREQRPTNEQSARQEQSGGTVWLATPVHLLTGLSTLHLDLRGVLRLSGHETALLSREFARLFEGSGYSLEPLESGDFLLFGPALSVPRTQEPARCAGESVAEALPQGPGSAELRRMSAEIEMWLHEHPVNGKRRARGLPPVTTLWLWGGGPVPSGVADGDVSRRDDPALAGEDVACGNDAFLRGLWAGDDSLRPLPQTLSDLFSYPRARRAVLVMEIGEMLQSNPGWTLMEAMEQVDQRFLLPAIDAVRRNAVDCLKVAGNDRLLRLRKSDRLRFWRRRRPGLSGLQ